AHPQGTAGLCPRPALVPARRPGGRGRPGPRHPEGRPSMTTLEPAVATESADPDTGTTTGHPRHAGDKPRATRKARPDRPDGRKQDRRSSRKRRRRSDVRRAWQLLRRHRGSNVPYVLAFLALMLESVTSVIDP